MKVLAIIGSPRKKYSYDMLKILENELKQINSFIEFRYAFLIEYNLKYCLGCSQCKENEEKCPLKDDSIKIKREMEESDLLIFNSPVYSGNVSGLFKNFCDRFHYLHFRPIFYSKKAMWLTVTSLNGTEITSKY
ncbi:MAG TPA: flavodoxin family protein, partial [Spirochaetota bacterium]|nr:flavodoxin family protein [Spirochaetota bacterium]